MPDWKTGVLKLRTVLLLICSANRIWRQWNGLEKRKFRLKSLFGFSDQGKLFVLEFIFLLKLVSTFCQVMLRQRVARWYIFEQKIQIYINFGGSCDGRCRYILCRFGIFYGHLVYFLFILYIFLILVCCSEKNLATLLRQFFESTKISIGPKFGCKKMFFGKLSIKSNNFGNRFWRLLGTQPGWLGHFFAEIGDKMLRNT
jgi:hypothetical protein